MSRNLTQDRLKEVLRYDSATGEFFWVVKMSNFVKAGTVAGYCRPPQFYRYIRVDGENYSAHRLAWLYVFGSMPDGETDHINGVPDDNKIANLRIGTRSENMQNQRRARKDSTTGILGVVKLRNLYQAKIVVAGKQLHLGTFGTKEEAGHAYLLKKRKLHRFCTI